MSLVQLILAPMASKRKTPSGKEESHGVITKKQKGDYSVPEEKTPTTATTATMAATMAATIAATIAIPGVRKPLRYPLSLATVEDIELAFRILGGKWGKPGDTFNESERTSVSKDDIAFTYGEVMPSSVRLMMDGWHLGASRATTMVDLGAGKGRLALQAFLEHRSLANVTAVEYSQSRYKYGRTMLQTLAKANPHLLAFEDVNKFICCLKLTEPQRSVRRLELRNGDLFDCQDTHSADIVICETAIPLLRQVEFTHYLAKMKSGARLLLYHELSTLLGTKSNPESKSSCIVMDIVRRQVVHRKTINTILGTFREVLLRRGYRTSWNVNHPFDIWIRT